ncbi:uncharacterized protein LOC131937735 [Physella acuta]|uniref:uncharacterized protein LOC131937735 n=1 Tax=Physella acuta TaxID=109671 RepID=UPI0027DDE323|nr:uncharacterized protein LOC131937735 [Physella acuta]
MAALLFKGVVKTGPVLLLTRCGTSIPSVKGHVYSRFQQSKALCSQTRAQQEENSFNVQQTVPVSKEHQLLLREIFNCSQEAVELIVTKHPRLKTMSIPLLEQKVNLLLSYNLPLSLITKNPAPLCHTSHEELSRRLELLQARSLLTDNPVRSQDKVFNYLVQSGSTFDVAYKNMCDELDALEGCANKSERIAQIFRCNQKDVDSLIAQHPRLETMSIPLLEQKVNLLLSYNLPLSLITKNVKSLYQTSHEELSRRLELLQARSLLTDNPVRSQDKVFNFLVQSGSTFDVAYKNMCDDLDALEGCANKSERIAQIFRCNQKDVDSLIAQHPRLETMSIPLLEQKVNLLLSFNLPLSLITKNVKPLYCISHEELSRRLELLQARSLLTDNPVRSQDKVFNYLVQSVKQFDIGYKNMCDDLDALEGCANKSELPLYHTSHQELSRRLQLLKAKSLLTESNFDYLGCSSKHFDAAYEKISAEIAALEGRPSKCQLL